MSTYTHMVRMVGLMKICVEILRRDIVCSREKEFNELIPINP